MKKEGLYRFKNLIVWVFMAVFVFSSCYKIDPDMISDDLIWSPDISLPLGDVQASLSQREADAIPPNTHVSKQLYDTLKFSLSDIVISDRDEIDSVMIRLNMVNEFPAQAHIFVFYPENGQSLDYDRSLTGDKPIIIAPGKIDDTGKSTIPSKKQTDIWLTSLQVDDLYTSDILVIRTDIIDMIITQPVKDNLAKYKFTTQIGLQAKISIAYE